MRKICLTVAEQAGLCPQKEIEADFEAKNNKEKSFTGNFLQSEAFFHCGVEHPAATALDTGYR